MELWNDDCFVLYQPNFLSSEEHDILFQKLLEINWGSYQLSNDRTPKRLIAWQSIKDTPEDGFYWKNANLDKNYAMLPEIRTILDRINQLTSSKYNAVLLNRYRHEKIYEDGV